MVQLIARRYQLGEMIGEGGMGAVYTALDTQTRQTVAVKHLKAAAIAHDPDMVERFEREAEALRELNHPNIVKVLDSITEDDNHYIIMEYERGGTLRDVILHKENLSIGRTLQIALDLADALTRSHRLNIIHRDLKPGNVLLSADGIPKLTDFGVALVERKARVTQTDGIVGTLDYLSPEAANGDNVDARADIWAFGVMLFEMLTGERPFPDLISVFTQPTPDLEALRPDAPIALVDLICRMLEKERQSRISSVRLIGAEIESLIAGTALDTSSFSIPIDASNNKRFDTPTPTVEEAAHHNLPTQTTPFIGRDLEVQEIARMLQEPTQRLITILAPGGMGKTRQALAVAGHFVQNTTTTRQQVFPQGIYFVALAPLTTYDQIVLAIGEAVGFPFHDDEPAQTQLLHFLAERQLLLVLDNYEHLIEHTSIVQAILQAAPQVKILVTSRTKLRLSAEQTFNLEGMEIHEWETIEQAQQYSAVKLFYQGAIRSNPSFAITEASLRQIERICQLVHGLPLGIVLAASWLEMLDIEEIADEIEQGIDFLETEMTDIPQRQRSIRAVFEYSWNLMTANEQAVFAKLSVFRGGFTREAAQAVSDANLRTLTNLMNKSLIRRDADSGRYEVHELLRQFAQESLTPTVLHATLQAHARFYAEFVSAEIPNLKGKAQVKALDAIEADMQNIHFAWLNAVEQGFTDILNQMIDGVHLFAILRGKTLHAYELFELARSGLDVRLGTDAPPLFGRLLARFPNKEQDAQTLFESVLQIAEASQNVAEIAFCQRELGVQLSHRTADNPQAVDRGIKILEQSLSQYQSLGDSFFEAYLLDDLGWAYAMINSLDARVAMIDKCLTIRREIGDLVGASNVLRSLSTTISNTQQAIDTLQEALSMMQQLRNQESIAWIYAMLAMRHSTNGDFEVATDYSEKSIRLAQYLGNQTLFQFAEMVDFWRQLIEQSTHERTRHEIFARVPSVESVSARPELIFYTTMTHSLYYGFECHFEQLQHILTTGFQLIAGFNNKYLNWIMPSYAVFADLSQEPAKAIQILAYAFVNNDEGSKWVTRCDFFINYRAELEARYPDSFAQSWECGVALSFDEVVAIIDTLVTDE